MTNKIFAKEAWADHILSKQTVSHLTTIVDNVTTDLKAKYIAGQLEHGGNLWEKPGLLDYAIEEVLDLVVYLYTLKQQWEKAAWTSGSVSPTRTTHE